MAKVFIMHKLKKGASMEDYRKWSPEDQRVSRSHPNVKDFRVYEIKESEGDKIPFDLIEVEEVESWEAHQDVVRSESIKRMEKTWLGKYVDEDSLVVLYGEEIQETK